MIVTHGLYPPEELEKARLAVANRPVADLDDERPARTSGARVEAAGPGVADEIAALKADVETLRTAVASLTAEVNNLKYQLGA